MNLDRKKGVFFYPISVRKLAAEKCVNVYLSCQQQLKVGTSAEPESNGASDQNLVSKSADEVEEKHTGMLNEQ